MSSESDESSGRQHAFTICCTTCAGPPARTTRASGRRRRLKAKGVTGQGGRSVDETCKAGRKKAMRPEANRMGSARSRGAGAWCGRTDTAFSAVRSPRKRASVPNLPRSHAPPPYCGPTSPCSPACHPHPPTHQHRAGVRSPARPARARAARAPRPPSSRDASSRADRGRPEGGRALQSGDQGGRRCVRVHVRARGCARAPACASER
eukprot:1134853-Pleurochrysis_carterae.AAC.1